MELTEELTGIMVILDFLPRVYNDRETGGIRNEHPLGFVNATPIVPSDKRLEVDAGDGGLLPPRAPTEQQNVAATEGTEGLAQ